MANRELGAFVFMFGILMSLIATVATKIIVICFFFLLVTLVVSIVIILDEDQ